MTDDSRAIRLRVPGTWVDAHLYRGSLLLWDHKGAVFSATTDDILSSVAKNYGTTVARVVEFAVLRNDWIANESVAALCELPGVSEVLSAIIDECKRTVVEVDTSVVKRQVSGPVGAYPNDVAIYANRLFSATSGGLFEARFNPRWTSHEDDEESLKEIAQVIPDPTATVSVRWEQIATASISAGVKTAEFGDNRFEDWRRVSENRKFSDVNVQAHSARFGSYALLAYSDDSAPVLMRGNKTRSKIFEDGDEKVVLAGFEEPEPAVERLLEKRYRDSDYHVLGNGIGRLLIESGGHYEVLNPVRDWETLHRHRDSGPSGRMAAKGPTYATHPFARGFALEHLDSVGIVDEHGYMTLDDVRPIRLRSFPASSRYKRTLAVITQEGCELLGLVGQLGFR